MQNRYEQLTLGNVLSRRRLTSDGWQDWEGVLNDSQRSAMLEIFGKGCRQDTKNRLAACFSDNCRRVKPCGIINRVLLEDDGASYCAGQDYPSEIATVRKVLIASY